MGRVNPKVKTRDILIWLVDQKSETFTNSGIMEQFDINHLDANVRIHRLKKWECVSNIERGMWRITSHGYRIVTNWKNRAEEQIRRDGITKEMEKGLMKSWLRKS